MYANTDKKTLCDTDGIIVPPGCNENGILDKSGEKVTVFTPPSYKAYCDDNPQDRTLPHCMSRKSGGLSVPKNAAPAAQKSMTDYLRRFVGAYIYLDLWMNNRTIIKKCGRLIDVGTDFIVLRGQSDGIALIDLEPVKYISIFCK